MKKIIYLFIAAAGLFLASCKKDEVGGTATQKMAGDWFVTVDAVDNNFNVTAKDAFGLGSTVQLLTYNTASNTDSIWINDMKNTWQFKVKLPVDLSKSTFGTATDILNNYTYDSKGVKVTGGKVLLGAAHTPSGMPADSIVFYVGFGDDSPAFSWYKVSGYRRTGFTADAP